MPGNIKSILIQSGYYNEIYDQIFNYILDNIIYNKPDNEIPIDYNIYQDRLKLTILDQIYYIQCNNIYINEVEEVLIEIIKEAGNNIKELYT